MPAAVAERIDPFLLSLAEAAGRRQDPVARQAIATIHAADWACHSVRLDMSMLDLASFPGKNAA